MGWNKISKFEQYTPVLEKEQDNLESPPHAPVVEEYVVNDWTEEDIKEEILNTFWDEEKFQARFSSYSSLFAFDVEQMVQVKIQQIKLVGSKKIYDEIDNNFRTCKFSPLFAKEQFDLYSWREGFFSKHFPTYPLRTYHNDFNEDEESIAVTHNITQLFDGIVALATSDRSGLRYVERERIVNENGIITLADDENGIPLEIGEVPYYTEFLFKREFSEYNTDIIMLDQQHPDHELIGDLFGGYKGVLSLVAAAHPSRLQSLEHLALKKVVSLDIPLEKLPSQIRVKVQ